MLLGKSIFIAFLTELALFEIVAVWLENGEFVALTVAFQARMTVLIEVRSYSSVR